ALSGCASVALLVSHYMIGMRSQLSEARDMTVRFDGKVVCGARVSKGAVADCGPISYLPSIATVSWKISPFEWAATDRQRHSAVVRVNGHVPPWFTNGDAIVFMLLQDLASDPANAPRAQQLLQHAIFRARWCAQAATSGGEGQARASHLQ